MWDSGKLRVALDKQGRTRKWLAEQCGITLGTLDQIFHGRKPSRPVTKLLVIALECKSPEDLGIDEVQQSHFGQGAVQM